MDIRNLSDQEVNLIINELKLLLERLDMNLLSSPFGRISTTHPILSQSNDIKFKIDIYRGNREPGRFTINLRFEETNDCLVRLDVEGGFHPNPDGSYSPNSHIHIYHNDYDKKDSYAYPIDLSEFPQIENLYNATVSFLDYANIQ